MNAKSQLQNLIEEHLHFQGKTNDKAWLQASVKTYYENGKISGSLYSAIENVVKKYVQQTIITTDGVVQPHCLKQHPELNTGNYCFKCAESISYFDKCGLNNETKSL